MWLYVLGTDVINTRNRVIKLFAFCFLCCCITLFYADICLKSRIIGCTKKKTISIKELVCIVIQLSCKILFNITWNVNIFLFRFTVLLEFIHRFSCHRNSCIDPFISSIIFLIWNYLIFIWCIETKYLIYEKKKAPAIINTFLT